MAIFHLSVKTVSRARGQTAVGAAAYRSGTRLRCARTGTIIDYRRRHGVRAARVMVPGGAERHREDLWNAAEAAERRCNATLAREFELALPEELTPTQQERVVVAFAEALIARYSIAVDWAIHEPSRAGDQRNVHAHVMTTSRTVDAHGSFGKKVRVLDARATGPAEVVAMRELAASLCNDALIAAGFAARVDPRSNADRGLIELPGSKLGVASAAIERRTGAPSERRLRQASERAEVEEAIAAAVARNGVAQNADNSRSAEIVVEHGPDRDDRSQVGVPRRNIHLWKFSTAGVALQDAHDAGLVVPTAYAPQPSDQRAPSNPQSQLAKFPEIRSGDANKRDGDAIRRARCSAIVLTPTTVPAAYQSRDNPVSGETPSMARDDNHRAAKTGVLDLDAQRSNAERPATGSGAEEVTIEEEHVLERGVLLSLRSRFVAEAKILRLRGPALPADANSSENALDALADNVATSASAHVSPNNGTVSTNAEPSSARSMTDGVQGRRLLDRDVMRMAQTPETAVVGKLADPKDQRSLRERSRGRRCRQNPYARPPTNLPRSSSAAVDQPMRRALLGVTNLSTAPDREEEKKAPEATIVEDLTAKVVAPCSFEDLYAACVELGALLLRVFQSHRHEPALLAILEATQNAIAIGSRGLSTSTALLAARLRKDIVGHTGALASVSVEQIYKRVSSALAAINTPELQRLLKAGRDRMDASSLSLNTRKDRTPSGDLDKGKLGDPGRGQT